jgi:hypothetical protein
MLSNQDPYPKTLSNQDPYPERFPIRIYTKRLKSGSLPKTLSNQDLYPKRFPSAIRIRTQNAFLSVQEPYPKRFLIRICPQNAFQSGYVPKTAMGQEPYL